jgi:hypothetical protein
MGWRRVSGRENGKLIPPVAGFARRDDRRNDAGMIRKTESEVMISRG